MLTGGAATGSAALAAVGTHSPALKTAAYAVDTQPPTAPTNLRLTEPSPGVVVLNWDPSTDLPLYPPSSVVAYDIYASASPFRLIASVPGTVTTFTDHRGPCEKVLYFVRARDAAGNVSAPSNIVVRHPSKRCEHKHGEHWHGTGDGDSEWPSHSIDEVDDSHHTDDDHDEIVKADRLFHVEGADGHGGGGHNRHDRDSYGGHDFGGPGDQGAESEAGGDHGGGPRHDSAQPAGHSLPLTGAPVAAVAGVGALLLVAGSAGVVISKRRRRTAGAR
ncbi:LPXTG cell wall anchor domain-containing protein [Sphaerisporangium dianthi]|uniref:LPXTG cell wall anchor domain-containing protein n=1 Tax=Sphaerisporangium dianthi TaxID=1436120 RepID=A0ABV9CG83_9ACTN